MAQVLWTRCPETDLRQFKWKALSIGKISTNFFLWLCSGQSSHIYKLDKCLLSTPPTDMKSTVDTPIINPDITPVKPGHCSMCGSWRLFVPLRTISTPSLNLANLLPLSDNTPYLDDPSESLLSSTGGHSCLKRLVGDQCQTRTLHQKEVKTVSAIINEVNNMIEYKVGDNLHPPMGNERISSYPSCSTTNFFQMAKRTRPTRRNVVFLLFIASYYKCIPLVNEPLSQHWLYPPPTHSSICTSMPGLSQARYSKN